MIRIPMFIICFTTQLLFSSSVILDESKIILSSVKGAFVYNDSVISVTTSADISFFNINTGVFQTYVIPEYELYSTEVSKIKDIDINIPYSWSESNKYFRPVSIRNVQYDYDNDFFELDVQFVYSHLEGDRNVVAGFYRLCRYDLKSYPKVVLIDTYVPYNDKHKGSVQLSHVAIHNKKTNDVDKYFIAKKDSSLSHLVISDIDNSDRGFEKFFPIPEDLDIQFFKRRTPIVTSIFLDNNDNVRVLLSNKPNVYDLNGNIVFNFSKDNTFEYLAECKKHETEMELNSKLYYDIYKKYQNELQYNLSGSFAKGFYHIDLSYKVDESLIYKSYFFDLKGNVSSSAPMKTPTKDDIFLCYFSSPNKNTYLLYQDFESEDTILKINMGQ